MEDNLKQDSFTIGTASKGGAIKVYFNADNEEEAIKKIKWAINTYFLLIEKNQR